jgi:hypothetical protein
VQTQSALERTAIFDQTGQYRYQLTRRWQNHGPNVAFVMLNPSRANAQQDDPTLRACIQFAQRWEYASLAVVNLFGYCTAQPAVLKTVADPVGPDNDDYLLSIVREADRVVLAWGNGGSWVGRDRTILTLLRPYQAKLSYLQINRSGQPRHPLYINRSLSLQPFDLVNHPSLLLDTANVQDLARQCKTPHRS